MFRSIVTNVCRGFGCLLAASCTIEMSVITRQDLRKPTKPISLFSVQKLLSIGSCKRLVDYLVMVFLNKSLTYDQAVLLPILFGRRGEGDAGFIYFTRRRPVVQNLDFCLIGRKTKDPSEPYTHRSSNISDFRNN